MATIQIVGRLGKDAELRYIPSGTAVCNLAIAYNYGKKQPDGKKLSQWAELALWGKQAESLAQYLKKGGRVSVIASDPHMEIFTRADGTQGSKLVAQVINIELLGDSQQVFEPAPTEQKAQPKQRDNFDTPYDDDIPF